MTELYGKLRMGAWLLAAFGSFPLGVSLLLAQNQPASSEPTSVSRKAPTEGKAGEYVGEETCVGCHADQQKRFKNTVMGKIYAHPRTELEKLGCQSCHGPGKAHVAAGGGKDTIPLRFGKDSNNSIEEQNAACLACHDARIMTQGSNPLPREIVL